MYRRYGSRVMQEQLPRSNYRGTVVEEAIAGKNVGWITGWFFTPPEVKTKGFLICSKIICQY
jgi:hypothetical protein